MSDIGETNDRNTCSALCRDEDTILNGAICMNNQHTHTDSHNLNNVVQDTPASSKGNRTRDDIPSLVDSETHMIAPVRNLPVATSSHNADVDSNEVGDQDAVKKDNR